MGQSERERSLSLFHVYSGAANAGFQGVSLTFNPPGRVRYSDGARSLTARVQTNDAGATITITWHGYTIKL